MNKVVEQTNAHELNFNNFVNSDKVVPLHLANNLKDYEPDIFLIPQMNQATWDLLHNAQFINQLTFCQSYSELEQIASDFKLKFCQNNINEHTDDRHIIQLYLGNRNVRKKAKSYMAKLNQYDHPITNAQMLDYVCDEVVHLDDTFEFPLGKIIGRLASNQIMFLNYAKNTCCHLTINQKAVTLQPLNVMNDQCCYLLTISEHTLINVHVDEHNGYCFVKCLTKKDANTLSANPGQSESIYFADQALQPLFVQGDDHASSFEKAINIEYVNVFQQNEYSFYRNPFLYKTSIIEFLQAMQQPVPQINNEVAEFYSSVQFKITNYQAKDFWLLKPVIKQTIRYKDMQTSQKPILIYSDRISHILMRRYCDQLIKSVSDVFDINLNEKSSDTEYCITLPSIRIKHPQDYVFNERGKWNDDVSSYDKVLNVVTLMQDNSDLQNFTTSLQKYLSIIVSVNQNFNYDRQQMQTIGQMMNEVDKLFVATLVLHDNQEQQVPNYQTLQQAVHQLLLLLQDFDQKFASYASKFYHDLWQKALERHLDQMTSIKDFADKLDMCAFDLNMKYHLS